MKYKGLHNTQTEAYHRGQTLPAYSNISIIKVGPTYITIGASSEQQSEYSQTISNFVQF